ncbi:MAG: ATP-binding protein [Oscillibacter sp.]
MADSERMKQVFCNVLDNAASTAAREAHRRERRVRGWKICHPRARLRSRHPGGAAVRQAEITRARARGSGIGLAVCDEIVRLHGGSFDIANAEGGGAVVTISLPMS